jgi:hypothetical protein
LRRQRLVERAGAFEQNEVAVFLIADADDVVGGLRRQLDNCERGGERRPLQELL